MSRLILLFKFCIVFSFACYSQPNPPAGKLMAIAYRQATKEDKNILLIFHASWCSWCHKMDDAINDKKCKQLFDSNYVVVHLTVAEKDSLKNTPGASAYLKRFNGENAGLPFWVITNNRGVWLGDSYMRDSTKTKDSVGINIGCPAEDNEVDAFCGLLKKTSKLTDKQLKVIAARFRKNKVSVKSVKKKE